MKLLAQKVFDRTPELKNRIIQKCEINEHEVIDAFTELLKFFHVISLSKRQCTPSLVIDNIWHEFILFTREYQAFCNEHFGRFIHHSPGGLIENNHAQYLYTLQKIRDEFKSINQTYWPLPATMCADFECGSCDS